MTQDALYWVWLQCALGISSSLRTQEIAAAFGNDAKAIFEAGDYDRRLAGVFTNLQLEKLQRVKLDDAQRVLEECARQNVHILTPREDDFPARLLHIPNCPLVLYVKGSLGALRTHLPISIVGTRRADRKSVDIAARLSADLAHAGCVIVSGGALGIDSAAHWGALHAKAATVAVLGCGHGSVYLPENATLREKIKQNGAVITEYPGSAAPIARNFPIRNRIISGISVGTVVVEAGERSGSLITATCAAEQGRDVFAVPGDAFGSTYTGGNKLIREGAKPVFSAMDVLEEYELLYPELLNMRNASRDLSRCAVMPDDVIVKKSKAPAQKNIPSTAPATQKPTRELSAEEAQIMALLRQKALHIDALLKETKLPLGRLFAALTTLEIDGLAKQTPGKIYESNEKL